MLSWFFLRKNNVKNRCEKISKKDKRKYKALRHFDHTSISNIQKKIIKNFKILNEK